MAIKRKLALLLALIMVLGVFTSCNNKGTESGQTRGENQEEKAQGNKINPIEKITEKQDDLLKAYAFADTSFLEEFKKDLVDVNLNMDTYKAQVEPYKLAEDLSNVENIGYFGSFTEAQRKALVANAFMISPSINESYNWDGNENVEFQYDQIFQIYEFNEYKNIPSFITTDSLTHIFHIFYDNFLRNLERDELYPKAQDLGQGLYEKSLQVYDQAVDPQVKEAARKNLAFASVLGKLIDLDLDVPADVKDLVEGELEKIESQSPDESEITGSMVDYSQMKPRGHYTRDEVLKSYFKYTMYAGQAGFFLVDNGKINEEGLIQSFLLTDSVFSDQDLIDSWSALVDPIDFLVETADDLSIRDFAKVLYSVYGRDFDLNDLADEEKIQVAYKLIQEEKPPQIGSFLGYSFRLISQRAVIDSVLMQNVVEPAEPGKPSRRPIYQGLDLMTAFGSQKAKEIQAADPYNSHWPEYKEKTEKNIAYVANMKDSDWTKNLYRGWLWMLESYKNVYGQGYPSFMTNEAWTRKDLVSALGSYAELKHDTVLYGKSVMAEMGGGGPVEMPKGYVEPNIELFDKLTWLLEFTKVNLKHRQMLSLETEEKLTSFEDMVIDLREIARKELENIPLTEEDFERIHYIGGEMEAIMIQFVQGDEADQYGLAYWYEIENDTDRRMPVVVDLMRVVDNSIGLDPGQISQIATGRPAEIYVVYPHQGKLYMGRGGIFSYYEFLADERMTDEEWQEQLLKGQEKELPTWYADIIQEPKEDFEGNLEAWDW
ncbi:MAG: DUF3160 domain-containing protein [Bacillota bacterium]|nr:DUF3160 domain-containing protein [Bacillota bacterium]